MIPIAGKTRVLVAIFAIFTLIGIMVLTYNKKTYKISSKSSNDVLFCHGIEDFDALPDISDKPPDKHKRNIFFLETTCNSALRGKLFIHPRQACAVESAARLNPNSDVYLLFASRGVIKDENTVSDRILQLLSTFPNIKILHFNVNKYVKNSPVENLWAEEIIKKSSYPVAHASDVLRLLTLWKYGGIYLDLDVIVIKNMENLPDNFAGAQSDNLVANGVMGFSSFGKGNLYVNECLHDMSKNFNGKEWGLNGPQLITRNIFKHCRQFDTQMLIRFGKCEEFRIFPSSKFYLIPYHHWNWFFNENYTAHILYYSEESSYLIHTWNKLSYKTLIKKKDVDVPYLNIASKYCPGTIEQLDDYF
ncbi:lactosylceramide 4-alpha-galactosyltransferase-like [Euwallacea fornicatus]|uniref:lactosylceramide 4-alpha-galactosyltransferase-like n=1 Tax=Euwallacea fornicatus TaxID=995702 RepID=UPI00338F3E81